MDILLTDVEVRLLGCLMEKEMATPNYYPLSLNALLNACNQKSNRNPVVTYDEEIVIHALNGLQERKLTRQSNLSRVPKYEQIFTKKLNLLNREAAVICLFLVRGPQTVGEIRGRTERLFSFQSLDEVQETITALEEMELVCKLPRQPGRKESRYTHLLSGVPPEDLGSTVTPPKAATVIIRKENDNISELRQQIDSLRQEVENLKNDFTTFKSQFE